MRGSEHPGEKVRKVGKGEGRDVNQIEPQQKEAAMEHKVACSCGNALPVSERGAAAFPLRAFPLIRVRQATEWNREAGTYRLPRGRS
jgi:hypothetical protein